jgi:hypothetical protein
VVGYPRKLYLDDVEYTDGKDVRNAFNTFFQSVFGVPCNNYSPESDQPLCTDTVSNVQTTASAVADLLKAIHITKGAGSDGLPAIFWSKSTKSLALPLSIIFNRFLREGIFPIKWKSARIVPVYKKGSRMDIKNYRGISVLSTPSKLLEKIVYEVIYSTLDPRTITRFSERAHHYN